MLNNLIEKESVRRKVTRASFFTTDLRILQRQQQEYIMYAQFHNSVLNFKQTCTFYFGIDLLAFK